MRTNIQEAPILEIKDLDVRVAGRTVLHNINLEVGAGETVILFGPNGVGKSSLFSTLMGFPNYEVVKGTIRFKGQDLLLLNTAERAQLGIGMAFQRPPTIKGIKLKALGQRISSATEASDRVSYFANNLGLASFLDRDINLGFSGGETKRSEVFQLLLQNPCLSLIDEPESGVDIENIGVVGVALKTLLQRGNHIRDRQKSGLIITHTGLILNYLNADRGVMLIDGTLSCSGNAREIFELIQERGYRECHKCLKIC
jgi:Fe-S cluster assembly ATP-binding protein